MSRTVLFGPFPPPSGGVASYVESLRDGLERYGLTCEVKAFRRVSGSPREDVEPTFASIMRHFASMRASDTCIDSCTFFIEYPSAPALAAWLLCRGRFRFRWVKVLHDATLPSRFRTLSTRRQLTARLASRHIDHLVAVTDELRDWAVSELGVPRHRTSVTGSLLPLPAPTEMLPVEVAHAFGAATVCTTGGFTSDYGLEHVAAAVAAVRESAATDVRLIVLDPGFSVEEDPALRARALDGRPWITVARALPRRSVLAILSRCSVFVRATRYESVGLSRIEALLSGIPVVATDVGETRGMRTFRFGDVAMLAREIRSALESAPDAAATAAVEAFRSQADANLRAVAALAGAVAVAA